MKPGALTRIFRGAEGVQLQPKTPNQTTQCTIYNEGQKLSFFKSTVKTVEESFLLKF